MTKHVWNWTKIAVLAIAIAGLPVIVATQAAQAQTLTVLHNFLDENGGWVPTSLVMDASGNLYGNAVYGGPYTCDPDFQGCGLIFELSRQGSHWSFSIIYLFGPETSNGYLPMGQLLLGSGGVLYGTTELGGACGDGTVFQLTPSSARVSATINAHWTLTRLHDFGCENNPDLYPYGGVVADAAGNLYGTTSAGGSHGCGGEYGCGVVYKLTRSNGEWNYSVLYTFAGLGDGARPLSNLTLDANGNLYGTTQLGGIAWGVVFKVTPNGSESVLHAFNTGDGGYSDTAVTVDSSGNLYGCTSVGQDGDPGGAGVFELSPGDNGWTYKAIYKFAAYYAQCNANLLVDAAGNLYGTSDNTGVYNSGGNTFSLAPSNGMWAYTSLHDFNYYTDGWWPLGIVLDNNTGNIYGVTQGGNNGAIAYELTP